MENQKKTKAVILLSGGLDSTVALAEALEHYHVIQVLSMDYGQRACKAELKASQAIAAHYDLPYQVLSLPWLKDLLPKALSSEDSGEQEQEQEATERVLDNRSQVPEETVSVWVPNRNGVFLNIAAAFAEAQQARVIIYGANQEEGQTFPDNTVAYREQLNACFVFSTLNHVQVKTPVGDLNKVQIIERGIALKAPLHLIWSCYDAGPEHCGECPSCVLLKKALSENKNLDCDKTAGIRFKSVKNSF